MARNAEIWQDRQKFWPFNKLNETDFLFKTLSNETRIPLNVRPLVSNRNLQI